MSLIDIDPRSAAVPTLTRFPRRPSTERLQLHRSLTLPRLQTFHCEVLVLPTRFLIEENLQSNIKLKRSRPGGASLILLRLGDSLLILPAAGQ